METAFVLYRSYRTEKEVKIISNLLEKEGIEHEIIKNAHELIEGIVGAQNLSSKFQIILQKKDFSAADDLVKINSKKNIEHLPKDYYIYNFTNDELLDVVYKPEEWGDIDYLLAKKILLEKGVVVDEEWYVAQEQNRLLELKRPKKANPLMIYAGYILAALGGFFGIVIGHLIWKSDKTLPNGEVVKVYRDEDRREGKRIFIIGCVILPVAIILKAWDKLEKAIV